MKILNMVIHREKNLEYIVNLLSDFILSKIPKHEDSIIEVIYIGNFFVVNGSTSSKTFIDLNLIKNEFIKTNSSLLQELNIKTINFLDVIKYEKTEYSKNIYVEVLDFDEQEKIESSVVNNFSVLSVKSKFPYGFSLNYDRLLKYYLEYISYHLFSVANCSKIKFKCERNLSNNEISLIDINSDSIYPKEKVLSLILDIFDFNLGNFNKTKVEGYNLLSEIDGDSLKPWFCKDKISDLIII